MKPDNKDDESMTWSTLFMMFCCGCCFPCTPPKDRQDEVFPERMRTISITVTSNSQNIQ